VPARRQRVWARTNHVFTDVAVSGVAIEDLLGDFRTEMGITRMLPGTTIGAIKGRVTFGHDTVTALGIPQVVLAGIIVAQDNIDAADLDPAFVTLDWMWYDRFAWFSPAAVPATTYPMSHEINVRAMRKLDEVGYSVFFAIGAAHTAGTIDAVLTTSVLLLLP